MVLKIVSNGKVGNDIDVETLEKGGRSDSRQLQDLSTTNGASTTYKDGMLRLLVLRK